MHGERGGAAAPPLSLPNCIFVGGQGQPGSAATSAAAVRVLTLPLTLTLTHTTLALAGGRGAACAVPLPAVTAQGDGADGSTPAALPSAPPRDARNVCQTRSPPVAVPGHPILL